MKENKDELIEKLLLVVEEKRAEISVIKNLRFKTSLSFNYGLGDEKYNLNVLPIEKLYVVLNFINDLIELNENNSKLGVNKLETWYGYSLFDWKDDVISKIKQKELILKTEELKTIEKTLNTLISEDKKKEIQLKEIMKKLDI